jgi:hypothetical protein
MPAQLTNQSHTIACNKSILNKYKPSSITRFVATTVFVVMCYCVSTYISSYHKMICFNLRHKVGAWRHDRIANMDQVNESGEIYRSAIYGRQLKWEDPILGRPNIYSPWQ